MSLVPLNETRVQDRMEIWDVRRRQRVRTIRSPAGVSIARYSPDGRFIAVADLRGRVQVLSTATWEAVTTSLTGGSAATWMAFAPRGDTLATGHADGTVRLWDVASGQAVGAPLPGVSHSTVIPMFTPDGTHLVAAHDTGRAYLWDLRSESLIRQACRVAGRRLTRAEWDEFLPGRAYAPAC